MQMTTTQASANLTSMIDFSPVINFGEDNYGGVDKTTEQTGSLTPRNDGSATASVGVGVGGDGSGGPVQKSYDEGTQPMNSGLMDNITTNKNTLYIVIAGIGVGGVIYFATRKNKKK